MVAVVIRSPFTHRVKAKQVSGCLRVSLKLVLEIWSLEIGVESGVPIMLHSLPNASTDAMSMFETLDPLRTSFEFALRNLQRSSDFDRLESDHAVRDHSSLVATFFEPWHEQSLNLWELRNTDSSKRANEKARRVQEIDTELPVLRNVITPSHRKA